MNISFTHRPKLSPRIPIKAALTARKTGEYPVDLAFNAIQWRHISISARHFFFNIMQQTMQHCGVALLKQPQTLL